MLAFLETTDCWRTMQTRLPVSGLFLSSFLCLSQHANARHRTRFSLASEFPRCVLTMERGVLPRGSWRESHSARQPGVVGVALSRLLLLKRAEVQNEVRDVR